MQSTSSRIVPGFKIVTDATSDLPSEMIDDGMIDVIPMEIVIDNELFTYGTTGNLTVQQFYTLLRDGRSASTSQISPAAYRKAFEPILGNGQDILYLGFSSGLSGTVSTAQIAANELLSLYPERRIVCVDTLCASVGEGLLVQGAQRKQRDGASLDETEKWVCQRRLNVCHWFTVDSLEYLRRSGRISTASATIGGLLNIIPLMHVDVEGKLQVTQKVRGSRKAMRKQLLCLQQGWMPQISRQVAIGHGDNVQEARELLNLLCAQFPQSQPYLTYIGPIIGAHTGPDVLAFIYWGNNR